MKVALQDVTAPMEAPVQDRRPCLETITTAELEAQRRHRGRLATRLCEWCSAVFQPRQRSQRFCCAQHRSFWHYALRQAAVEAVPAQPALLLRAAPKLMARVVALERARKALDAPSESADE
jgi:hypothetical protein